MQQQHISSSGGGSHVEEAAHAADAEEPGVVPAEEAGGGGVGVVLLRLRERPGEGNGVSVRAEGHAQVRRVDGGRLVCKERRFRVSAARSRGELAVGEEHTGVVRDAEVGRPRGRRGVKEG